jgi:para-aminobenzoate synthetase
VSTDVAGLFRERAGRHDRMFWLDGGGSRDWSGRRSILGFLSDDDVSLTFDAAARQVVRHRGRRREVVGDDIFAVLEEAVHAEGGDPDVSWVGYLGYASRVDLPARPAQGVPDAVWMRVRNPLVVDHPQPPPIPEGERSGHGPHQPPISEEYRDAFAEVGRQLRLGNSYEVNLTYRETATSATSPVDAYLRLREINPAPYAGFLRHHGVSVLSSSPERFATVSRERWLETRPIKGTTVRGRSPAEDEASRRELTTDPKLRAENLMIVDLLRNDVGMVCEPGTVDVPDLMRVESYPSVHQLVSTVRGRLRPELSTVAALRALFPAGSMTGAPKLRTMQIIDAVEATPRGVYAGALGWVSGDGRADLGVVIRTLVATGSGGGITFRSDLATEYDETRWKVARLLDALHG